MSINADEDEVKKSTEQLSRSPQLDCELPIAISLLPVKSLRREGHRI
jgi:hypothetical protein